MLASLLIVFREVLEAGLIIGIVMAATRGVAGRTGWIGLGIGGGILGACLVAAFAGAIADALAGIGQEIFNAGILIATVLMLGWHTVWMARHGRETARQMTAMGTAVAAGQTSMLALTLVVALAILREGSEIVLFLYGIAAASNNEAPLAMSIGSLLGIALGAAVAWLLYRGLLAIPTRRLFAVTSWMIALLAAGMAGQASAYLAQVDVIPTWGDQLWDTSAILPDHSILGLALRALVGYSDRPMGVQIVVYLAVLVALILLARMAARAAPPPARTGSAAPS